MLQRLQKIDPTSFLKFDWTHEYGTTGNFIHKSMPPFIVLLINMIVIYLLNLASVFERYDSHSDY